MLHLIRQWLLPTLCCLCGIDSEQSLCPVCATLLPWRSQQGCYQCGGFLEDGLESVRCTRCLGSPPPFDRVISLFDYQPPIPKMLSQLKHAKQLIYGRVLGELLSHHLKESSYRLSELPEVILPVPLHAKRLRKRGFNQAVELALPISSKLQIRIDERYCVRTKATRQQQFLKKAERYNNVQGAFQIVKSLPWKHVAVVDDVITTGQTVKAFCSVLRKGGVEQIDVWTIAQA